MLASRLGTFEGLHVADLFAGSGALGLEALSRGAAHCTFVEQDGVALDALRANVASLDARDDSDILATSVMALPPARRPYDLLLLDPPYDTGAGAVALDRLRRLNWLAVGALISVETAVHEQVAVSGLELEAERRHGKAKLTLLRAGANAVAGAHDVP